MVGRFWDGHKSVEWIDWLLYTDGHHAHAHTWLAFTHTYVHKIKNQKHFKRQRTKLISENTSYYRWAEEEGRCVVS
jgi:hypothetical protein